MVSGVKKVKFPTPGVTKEKEVVTLIDQVRMLACYNQDNPSGKAQRITQKVINHTETLAKEAGWLGAVVAKDAVTGHTAGMVLIRDTKKTNTLNVVDAEVVVPKRLKSPKN